MAKTKTSLREECVRLRVEQRLSLREIHEITGAAKGSLSKWLAEHPLSEDERKARRHRQERYRTPKKERGAESELHRLVQRTVFSKHEKAKIAEAAVLLRLVLHHLRPFGSPFDGDRTDWLVEVPSGSVAKVQVRWVSAGSRYGLPFVSLSCVEGHGTRRRFQAGEFDFIVGYDLFSDTAYVWSWDEVSHLKSTVSICPEAAERWGKFVGR